MGPNKEQASSAKGAGADEVEKGAAVAAEGEGLISRGLEAVGVAREVEGGEEVGECVDGASGPHHYLRREDEEVIIRF